MTTVKKFLCGAAAASLVAGAGAAVGTQVGLSKVTADWMLTAEHVLLIGLDGVNLSKVLEYAYNDDSGFKTAMDQGITGTASIINHTTLSGPSWSTVLTGVWDDKHGVFNNIFRAEPYNLWPSVFNLIEYNKPEINTTIISNWEYLNQLADSGGYPVDNNVFVGPGDSPADSDASVTALTIAQILATADNPDDISNFLFSYQSQADHAGHEFAGGSEEYQQAIINLGGNLQQILAAIAQVQALTGDDWSIMITTDHGHQQTVTLPGLSIGHGFQSPNETSSFVIFDQAGNNATDGSQNLNFSIADITPTILSLFGIDLRSDFDGVSLTDDPTVLNSHVTPVDLQQALLAALAMYGYPNIGNELTLGFRTLVGSVPYFLNTFVNQIDQFLQGIVNQDIFLISGLAEGAQLINGFFGGLTVDITNTVAQGITHLLGSGVIAPTDAPLPGVAEFTGLESLLDFDALVG
ncbi:phosphodiesterase [Mycolicibacter minnesotensis]|uniref:Phosphodiesterase n=1 Tax=Mycolicibacter minnesotensis TaxID=1118379 RepID=A0A7I7R548_9MYCO|nr:alkaline phosphatase family protein [Mycolicibacter minnesotensis]ORB00388.1 phosphodiesterase [Mycolicibacter minnesotensis]BBY33764.1 hypothetical protein MMIN_18250 [Mycolicibacter minnesotensis]